MTPNRSPAIMRMFKLLVLGLVVAALIVALGYLPTNADGGDAVDGFASDGCVGTRPLRRVERLV